MKERQKRRTDDDETAGHIQRGGSTEEIIQAWGYIGAAERHRLDGISTGTCARVIKGAEKQRQPVGV